jgi:hypothetical protein
MREREREREEDVDEGEDETIRNRYTERASGRLVATRM